MCTGCKHVSPDDLDEKLFASDSNATQIEKQHQPAVSGSTKRHAWHWKHALASSLDDEDVSVRKVHSSSSLESSRRGSACSSQSSPIRSSPKKSKDQQLKKCAAESSCEEHVNQRVRKDHKDKGDGNYNENRLSAGSRLYSVLEEQALGEAIRGSVENLYMESNRPINFCTTATLSTNTWY